MQSALGPPDSGYASLAAYIVCLARRACGGAIHLIVELVERLPVLAERPRAVAYEQRGVRRGSDGGSL